MHKEGTCFSVCAIVFTNHLPNFWCGLKMRNFAENTKKSGFSIIRKGQEWPKNVKKVESTIGPSMLRNILGPIFDSKK